MDNFTTAITVLLTGFIVVFAVLLLLIAVVKIYGTIVYNAQNKAKEKKDSQAPKPSKSSVQKSTVIPTASGAAAVSAQGAVSEEIIAVIAAAVDSIYSGSGIKTTIKSIKRSDAQSPRSGWGMAGRMDNTRPF
ncbi:MAG: OadG family protein [Acutalibacteraceae bacterium]